VEAVRHEGDRRGEYLLKGDDVDLTVAGFLRGLVGSFGGL